MGKNQSASNLTNIIKQDADGSIAFMHGNTMLMALSNTGQMSGSAPAASAITASYADNFLVKGNLTAQTLVVQTITSSVVYSSGSNVFGNTSSNTQTFTGSILISGSVGIGTSLPSSSLHIYNPSTFAALRLQNISGVSSSNYVIQTDSAGLGNNGFGIYDVVNSAYRLIINNLGSIGIGTTSPSSYGSPRKLHVHSTDDTRGILIQNTYSGSFAELHFSASREYRIGVGGSATDSGSTANNFYIFDNTAGAHRLTISSSGNIGINTTTPAYTLDVNGTGKFNTALTIGATESTFNLASATKLQIKNSLLIGYSTTGTFLGMNLAYNTDWKYISTGYASLYSQDAGDHLFFTATSSAAGNTATINEKMRITNAGNVGIGITNPSVKLHTYSTSSGLLSLYESTTSDTQIRFINSSTGGRTYSMGSGGSSSAGGNGFYLYDETAYLPRIYLNSFGSVGIGVTNISWNYSGIQALQIKNGFLYGYSNYEVGIGANAYYASGWKFIEAATATMYFCANRVHEFRNSTTTGTANANITWTTPLRIDPSGYVYKDSQPIISGQVGTTQSAGLTVGTLIPFDDFWVSRGITYNSSTRRFTVPVAGVYRITLNPFFISGVASGRVLIGINTDTPTPANSKGNTYREAALYDTGCLNSVVTLAASDYIVFLIYQGQLYNGGLSDAFNQFSIELIG
jgi:hypothetical protein